MPIANSHCIIRLSCLSCLSFYFVGSFLSNLTLGRIIVFHKLCSAYCVDLETFTQTGVTGLEIPSSHQFMYPYQLISCLGYNKFFQDHLSDEFFQDN